jgi:DNA-binding response OmpR family regulator
VVKLVAGECSQRLNLLSGQFQQELRTSKRGRMDKKIVLAEDSRTIGAFIKDFLKDAGYEVVHETDGQQALDRICEERPDLVILDVILPGKDGYQIARYLRESEDDELRAIPIIILSSREALVSGVSEPSSLAEAYFLKPVDKDKLIAAVRKLLS